MQIAQNSVQAKPEATVQAPETPVPVQSEEPGISQKKKPSRGWIWIIVGGIVIIGGLVAYFQFLR